MKKPLLFFGMLLIILFNGCQKKDKELEKDVKSIGDLMCRSMEIMNKLTAANPSDTMMMQYLLKKNDDLQAEMNGVYSKFREKYADKLKDTTFYREFNAEVKKVLLDCKYLSKEDRENFLKEME